MQPHPFALLRAVPGIEELPALWPRSFATRPPPYWRGSGLRGSYEKELASNRAKTALRGLTQSSG